MTAKEWEREAKRLSNRIVVNPSVVHGKPHFRGTRIMVSIVLDNLAAGVSKREILKAYPSLEPDDIQAALVWASFMAHGSQE